MCSYFWYLKHCVRWQSLWYNLQYLSLFWNNNFSLMNMLIYTDEIIFTIKHITILLNLMTFLNHCACRISILFLKCLFCLISCCIVFFAWCSWEQQLTFHASWLKIFFDWSVSSCSLLSVSYYSALAALSFFLY